jgi:uncharacterized membrane-anchored protein YjiN (DUF445 family)
MAIATSPPTSPKTSLPMSKSMEAKQQRLILMRRRAGALLAAVTVLFVVVTALGADGWLGYLQATAEASMVGGLADWFAVTALFRHPLGLPIPHTAIIPERKDQFGATLGEFVQESFLSPDAITERVRNAAVASRVATWLSDPANAHRLAGHALDAAVAAADVVRDEEVHRVLEDMVRERIEAIAVAPTAGRVLRALTEDGRHHEVIEVALRALERFLNEHSEDLRARFERESPWWLPGAVEDRIFDRLLTGARAVLRDAAENPEHSLREPIDRRLRTLADELEHSPAMLERGEQLKRDLLAQPQIRQWTASLWGDAKAALRAQADDPTSELRTRIAGAIQAGGERLRDDPTLLTKVDGTVERAVRYVAEHFDGEIAALVSSTIDRWDAEETSQRLELLLGPDLQYIRINGTVVGAAAGLALHSVAQALH